MSLHPFPTRGGGQLSVLLLPASMAFAMWVMAAAPVRPRRRPPHASVTFSSSVADDPEDRYVQRVRALDETALLEDMTRLAHTLAVGLDGKFRRTNASLYALLAAVVLAVAAWIAH